MTTNVYMTGGSGSGKTMLAAAIRHCLVATYPNLNALGATTADASNIASETFATPTGRYVVVDAPASTLQAALSIAPKMDIALLVISTTDGPQQGTIDAIENAKAMGVSNIVVYLSKTDIDEDEELYELLELQVRELLTHHGGDDGDTALVLWGSAKEALKSSGTPSDANTASIFALINAIEQIARV